MQTSYERILDFLLAACSGFFNLLSFWVLSNSCHYEYLCNWKRKGKYKVQYLKRNVASPELKELSLMGKLTSHLYSRKGNCAALMHYMFIMFSFIILRKTDKREHFNLSSKQYILQNGTELQYHSQPEDRCVTVL